MAALRRQARSLLERVMKDPLYPINEKMKAALDPNVTSASLLQIRPLAQTQPHRKCLVLPNQ